MVKIQSSKSSRANDSIKFGIGEKMINVSFDENRCAEVSEDIVIDLLKGDSSLSILDKEVETELLKKEVDETEELKKQIVILEETIVKLEKENTEYKIKIEDLGGDTTLSDAKVSKSDLKKMTVEDLKSLAKEASLLEAEYVTLKKNELVNYLFDKMNA
jgi:hypothetical protein